MALALAATLTKTLSCPVIVEEIARNIALLTTPLRNIPERRLPRDLACPGRGRCLLDDLGASIAQAHDAPPQGAAE